MTAHVPPELTFSFTTDTATLAVFDPERLRHRLSDDADWWSIPREEVSEINRGNLLAVSTGSDGRYQVELFLGCSACKPAAVTAHVACESGRLFIGPGEVIPSDGLMPTDEFGGIFRDSAPGTYRVCVSRPSVWTLRVCLEPADSPAQNNFDDSPRLHECA